VPSEYSRKTQGVKLGVVMKMQALARKIYSEEEYWAIEETSPVKHEYWDGELYAMAGGTFNHAEISGNVLTALRQRLKGKPCRALGSDLRIKVDKSAKRFNTYPDISIACPPFEWEKRRSGVKDTLLNPRVLIEVLSRSTGEYDRTAKFDEYKLLDSLTDYVLIWQDRVRIEHFHRENGNWILKSYAHRDDILALPEWAISLPLAEIYEGVDVPEVLQLFSAIEDEDY
jgi:Uma2 family endonuclease